MEHYGDDDDVDEGGVEHYGDYDDVDDDVD